MYSETRRLEPDLFQFWNTLAQRSWKSQYALKIEPIFDIALFTVHKQHSLHYYFQFDKEFKRKIDLDYIFSEK